jgi:hypothetical protein
VAGMLAGRRAAPRVGSPRGYGHPLQVVGEDPQAHPGAGAAEPAKPVAPQPKGALEVPDAGLNADPPVAQPLKRPGPQPRGLSPRIAKPQWAWTGIMPIG